MPLLPGRILRRRLAVNNPRDSRDAAETFSPDDSAKPRKWWQWLLLYPGLVIAVLGAIPTLVELRRSFTLDVPFGNGAEAEKQLRLWQVNFDCMNKLPVIRPIRNEQNIEVASVVCDTGDVLIVGTLPDRSKQMKWVSWSDVIPAPQTRLARYSLSKAADANAPPVDAAATVVCQRWLKKGVLLQRIGMRDGCIDRTVNAPTGRVVGSRPAPCDPSCR
jgi:hypothetical protein